MRVCMFAGSSGAHLRHIRFRATRCARSNPGSARRRVVTILTRPDLRDGPRSETHERFRADPGIIVHVFDLKTISGACSM